MTAINPTEPSDPQTGYPYPTQPPPEPCSLEVPEEEDKKEEDETEEA